MSLFIILFQLSFGAESLIKSETNFVSDTVLLKKKISQGTLEVRCKEQTLESQNQITIDYKINPKNLKGVLLETKTYNNCNSYKLKISSNKNLILSSSPGNAVNEAGSKLTIFYNWLNKGQHYVESKKILYSPFSEIEKIYKQQLLQNQIAQAENTLIVNAKKVKAALDAELTDSARICNEFNLSYLKLSEQQFKKKSYEQSFETLLLMKHKFGNPQNIFFNSKLKNNSVTIICQKENLDTDQSLEQFSLFARKYLNNIEYTPFLIKKARQEINKKLSISHENAIQILKFVSFNLKKSSPGNQIKLQLDLIENLNLIVKDNADHNEYEHLIEEDTHLIFLLAQQNKCKLIPKSVLNRISLKDDNSETLKSMSLIAAEDFYSEGLQKSALFEYKQFVQSKAILKKCDQIPKTVFERYFEFIKQQPFEL